MSHSLAFRRLSLSLYLATRSKHRKLNEEEVSAGKNELQFNNEFGLYVSDGDSHMHVVYDVGDRLHPAYM